MMRLTALALCALFLLTACGEGVVVQEGPTPTPDPLAFFEPTVISPGRAENPLEVLYVPPNAADPGIQAAADTITSLLATRSELAVRVVTVGTQAEALDILCDTTDGTRFAAAWLNGPTAVLAEARGCGERVLKATFDGADGFAGEVRAASAGSLNGLVGQSLCRYEASEFVSFYNWTLPVLAMQANSLDPTQMTDVVDIATDNLDVVQTGVQDGSCYALGAPEGLLGDDTNLVTVYTSPVVPLGMLFVPSELLLDDRAALIAAYLEIGSYEELAPEGDAPANTDNVAAEAPSLRPFYTADIATLPLSDEGRALTRLVGGEGVAPVTETDLDEMRDFMVQAGFNLEGFAR